MTIFKHKAKLKESTFSEWLCTLYLDSTINSLLELAMAPHSSTLAWRIPWTEEPGGLQSMGSLRVGHDWATSLSRFTFMHWRRKWQPTPVFLPGESQGWGSLVGCRLWGCTESDTTEVTQQQQQQSWFITLLSFHPSMHSVLMHKCICINLCTCINPPNCLFLLWQCSFYLEEEE